ncbi:hypothetical protein [Streptomyces sp. NBC_01352]
MSVAMIAVMTGEAMTVGTAVVSAVTTIAERLRAVTTVPRDRAAMTVGTAVASGVMTTVAGTAVAGAMTVERATVGHVRRSVVMTVRPDRAVTIVPRRRVGTTVRPGRVGMTVRPGRAGMTVPPGRGVTTVGTAVASGVTVTVRPSGVTTVASVGSA